VRVALARNPGSVNGGLAGGTVMSLLTQRGGGIVIAIYTDPRRHGT
jgi:hypothetical protein